MWCSFSDGQVDLNYANPRVLIEIIKILLFYISKGASIIRLDALAYLWKDPNDSSYATNESMIITKILRSVVRKSAPKVRLLAEVVSPTEENIQYAGRNRAHMIYNFPLETLLYSAILSGSSINLTDYLKNQNDTDSYFLNLAATHDGLHTNPVKGLISAADLKAMADDTKKKGYVVNETKNKQPRSYNLSYLDAAGSKEALMATQAIILALQGVPYIYFNCLFGSRSAKPRKDPRSANRERYSYSKLKKRLQDEKSERHWIYENYCRLIEIRKNHRQFNPRKKQEIIDLGPSVVAIRRDDILCVTNITNEVANIISVFRESKDLISDNEFQEEIILAPYQTVWLIQKN
jgi:sucrose phosphorylase